MVDTGRYVVNRTVNNDLRMRATSSLVPPSTTTLSGALHSFEVAVPVGLPVGNNISADHPV